MCAGPVWTLTGPSCGCRSSCSSPNLALDLSHTFWWRCHPVSVGSMATFSYEDWVPLSDTVPYFWVNAFFRHLKKVKRHYAALLRFIHLSLVYRGLLCGVDVCWSSLDTYWPLMWLSVLLFQSESCPGLVTHLLVKMPPRSVCSMATFLCACTYVHVLCVGFCLISVCVITRLYYIVHAYSAFPILGPITSIEIEIE